MVRMKEKVRPGERGCYQGCKRAFDVAASLAALLLIWPVMLVITLLVRLQDGGRALYAQERLGRYGQRFRMWKFRSMVPDADCIAESLSDEQKAQYNAEFKIDHDPRVTRLGAFLRRTSLDELPQLWNILKGEMSLVGPRPIVPEEARCYSPEQLEVFHSVPPGLTGLWQTCASNQDTYTTGGRQRMELHYAQSADFLMDIRLIFKTFRAVVRKAKDGSS